jgi:hypothetical protein
MPAERLNHVHMYQEDPLCAVLWYRKHLNARPNGLGPLPTEAGCKVERSERSWPALELEGTSRQPAGGVTFDDVSVQWYSRQGDAPPMSTRGHLADHFALSVTNLDAWIAKLGREGVRLLGQETELGDGRQRIEGLGRPYKLGDTRAIMIEGPSHEAIELVEVK